MIAFVRVLDIAILTDGEMEQDKSYSALPQICRQKIHETNPDESHENLQKVQL